MHIDNAHPALRRAWHPVCRVEDLVADGVTAVRLLGEDWAVARLGDDGLVAVVDRCPHRAAPLSAGRVVDGTLECAYHGYRYDGSGRCVLIPALGADATIPPAARVEAAFAVEERYGLVWLAPEEPVAPILDVPEWDDPAFVVAPLPPSSWSAGAAHMTDNFLDLGHLPFIHLDTFGDPDEIVVPPYTLERDGWTFTVDCLHSTRVLSGQEQHAERRSTWWYAAPFSLRLRVEYYADDAVLTILFFHQPVDADTTTLYCFDLRNDIRDGRATVEGTVAYQSAISGEDKAMLERLTTKAMPLDPRAELHTKADRNTLELRRVLADLVRLG